MPKVFLGYLHPHQIHANFHHSYQQLVLRDLAGPRLLSHQSPVTCNAGGIPLGRNQITEAFLQSDDDWLFMVDSDMGFESDSLERLLAVADPESAPIVGGLAFAAKEQGSDGMGGYVLAPRPTVFATHRGEDGKNRLVGMLHYPVNQIIRVAGTGAAFLLIHRSVVERIEGGFGKTWWDRMPGPDGLLGEDISFCVRAGSLDIPIYVHTGVRTTHQKTFWLSERHFWDHFVPPVPTFDVDVIIPVVDEPSRYGNAGRLSDSLSATYGRARPVFVVDSDDHARALNAADAVVQSGSFATKVNAAYRETSAEWLMLVGDDVVFHPGWMHHAEQVARQYDAQVVGTNDLANDRVTRGEHATHMLLRRSYVDKVGGSWDGPGVVAHEGYRHWYVDDEIVSAAKQRGVFQSALGSVVEHMHPMVGKASSDSVYELGFESRDVDKELFVERFRDHVEYAGA